LKSFVKDVSKSNWSKKIDELFDPKEFKKIEGNQTNGLYNNIYIKIELMDHFKDLMILVTGLGKMGSRNKVILTSRSRSGCCWCSFRH
jgi:hypothetical protein